MSSGEQLREERNYALGIGADLRDAREKTAIGNLTNMIESSM